MYPLLAALFALLAVFFLVFWIRSHRGYSNLRDKYKPIIDVQAERDRIAKERDDLTREVATRREQWSREYSETITELETLTKALDAARDDAELQSFGLYKPLYDFDTSEEYKAQLSAVRDQQKQMVRDKTAAVCPVQWQVDGSTAKGRQMTNRLLKLQLRAFNGESDAAVAKVKYNNIVALQARIEKAFDAVNKLGASNRCEIVHAYFDLKLQELSLAHEYQVKKQEEKEEQRQIREQMREEERAQRELEAAQKEAEREERRYNKALEQAREDLTHATEAQKAKLEGQVAELQRRLEEAQTNKERAMSRAQMTKSGHVYVISNIGSFGESVYKIGMTRRLEPLDRVKELGDASVPFPFDIHAMIFCENAPELENRLHRTFDDRRLNLVNMRKEFFSVNLAEVEAIAREHDAEVHFTKAAEAAEYRQTSAMREERLRAAQQADDGNGQGESDSVVTEARSALERRRALWDSTSPGSA